MEEHFVREKSVHSGFGVLRCPVFKKFLLLFFVGGFSFLIIRKTKQTILILFFCTQSQNKMLPVPHFDYYTLTGYLIPVTSTWLGFNLPSVRAHFFSCTSIVESPVLPLPFWRCSIWLRSGECGGHFSIVNVSCSITSVRCFELFTWCISHQHTMGTLWS